MGAMTSGDRWLLVVLVVLATSGVTMAEVPRSIRMHRRQCVEEGQVRACRTWLRETLLPVLCRPVPWEGLPELDPARALGAGAGGEHVLPPCDEVPQEVAPRVRGKEDRVALRHVKELAGREADLEKDTWVTLLLAGLEVIDPRDDAPATAAMTEIEGWESHPLARRIASRLSPGTLLLSAQVRFRQGMWTDAATRALAFLDLFRWDRRAGLARLLAARALALDGRLPAALHQLEEVQRGGTEEERRRARSFAGLVLFHHLAGSRAKGGAPLVLEARRKDRRVLRGLSRVHDAAAAPDGTLAIAGKEGIVLVSGATGVPTTPYLGRECRAVTFDARGGVIAGSPAAGLVRLAPPERPGGKWARDLHFDPAPRGSDQRARERWIRLFQDTDDVFCNLEGALHVHLSGRDTMVVVPPSRREQQTRNVQVVISGSQRPAGFCPGPGERIHVLGNRVRKGVIVAWTTTPGGRPRQATFLGPAALRNIVDVESDSLGWLWILARQGYRKHQLLVVDPATWQIRARTSLLQGMDLVAVTPDEAGGAWVVGVLRGQAILNHYVPGGAQ